MNIQLTQRNIDCMSASMNLDSSSICPMGIDVEEGKVLGGFFDGYCGVYDKERYDKIVKAKIANGWVPGRPHGYKHKPDTIAKMKNRSAKGLTTSKKNISGVNSHCSCLFCKKQTNVGWLNKSHKGCK